MKRTAICALSGMLLFALAGCGAADDPAQNPYPEDSCGVQVHWDALTAYQAESNLYTRRYEGYTDHLIPAADYGELLAFPGKRVNGEWMSGDLYGLVTRQGEIVVDPVYTQVYLYERYNTAERKLEHLPFLILRKVIGGEEYADISEYTVAAPDGSWCCGPYTGRILVGGDGDILVLQTQEQGILALKSDGTICWQKTAEELGIDFGQSSWTITDGLFALWDNGGDGQLYDLTSGEWIGEIAEGVGYISAFLDGLSIVYDYSDGEQRVGYVDEKGQWVLPAEYLDGEAFYNGYAAVTFRDGTDGIIDTAGRVQLSFEEGALYTSYGDDGAPLYIHVQQNVGTKAIGMGHYELDRVLAVYDASLQPSQALRSGETIVWLGDGYWIVQDDQLFLANGAARAALTLTQGGELSYAFFDGDLLFVSCMVSDGTESTFLYDRDGTLILEQGDYEWISYLYDQSSGEVYLTAMKEDVTYTLMAATGEVLLENLRSYPQVDRGVAIVQNDLSTSLVELNGGKEFFRYLVMDNDV